MELWDELIEILFLDIETCPRMVSIRNFSQHLFRIVNLSMWSMPLCVQSNVSWDVFYIYIGCFVFWVGLLLPLLCLSDFLLNPGIWQCCRASFSVNPVKHTGGFTIKPNLGLWLMQVYVNSCVCFCVLCIYSEGPFQREKEDEQNLWSESWKMDLFINDIIRTVFSLG